ncbi:sensor histidine kinase KdpD [Neomegalonema sp.]|uniref:sensor histidine kinase n=1 Tax=Neomegalonema sp. TaxID=2039713 RepID=UPI002610C9FA|nr:HAMP domain-containing sensor histidine kinase [Neomegalonema sp.]MDD2867549.1 HAMP domain-containing sensor histidine kinase [Neomegalonema sp.]
MTAGGMQDATRGAMGASTEEEALLWAARSLFSRGDMAIALLDPDLRVTHVLGGEKFAASVGDDALEAFPALIGCEETLRRIRSGEELRGLSFENVSIHCGGDGESPQYVNLRAYLDPHSGQLALVLQDAAETARLQRNLVQQRNELALARQALETARDEALAASRAKSAFLANISHELRTPLNVVIGNAEILRRPRASALTSAEAADYAGDILSSGELLLDLINDLIDLSRAETGDLHLAESWCDLGFIAHQSLRYAARLDDGRDKRFVEAADPHLPPFWGDERRLKQILLNLLSNAAKFSPSGGTVVLRVEREPQGGLLLEVADEGPGLEADEVAVALEPFGQLESGKRHKGTGLGLPIVKSLARFHGGDLEIVTAPGRGLRARVRLPGARFSPRDSA